MREFCETSISRRDVSKYCRLPLPAEYGDFYEWLTNKFRFLNISPKYHQKDSWDIVDNTETIEARWISIIDIVELNIVNENSRETAKLLLSALAQQDGAIVKKKRES